MYVYVPNMNMYKRMNMFKYMEMDMYIETDTVLTLRPNFFN